MTYHPSPFILTKLIKMAILGGELFEYILAHRYLKEKDAKRFFAQLISSVQYMHKRKIVHRDLKLVSKFNNTQHDKYNKE
jgi:serine/threonine protein kinase